MVIAKSSALRRCPARLRMEKERESTHDMRFADQVSHPYYFIYSNNIYVYIYIYARRPLDYICLRNKTHMGRHWLGCPCASTVASTVPSQAQQRRSSTGTAASLGVDLNGSWWVITWVNLWSWDEIHDEHHRFHFGAEHEGEY